METTVDRAELEAQIIARLRAFDEAALWEMDEITQRAEAEAHGGATATPSPPSLLTRRQMLVGLAAGGAVITTANLAAAIWTTTRSVELVKLRGLVALYENLERVGLDALIGTATQALGFALEGIEAGSRGLQTALSLIDGALARFEATFPNIRSGLARVEEIVDALDWQIEGLWAIVAQATERVSPMAEALGDFFSALLDLIPFGVGERIREITARIQELIGGLPDAMDSLKAHLLEPLRQDWFSDDETKGLRGDLIEPLRDRLLSPLNALLDDVIAFTDQWEAKLVSPIEDALAQRAAIRQQIDEYRRDNGLQSAGYEGAADKSRRLG